MALRQQEAPRLSPIRPIVIIGSSPGTANMVTNARSPMIRPKRARVGVDRAPETRAKAREKIKGKTRVDPPAQGDLEQEMVHPEDEEAIVLLPLAGPLLPPTGNKFEEPPRVARRIARYVPFI